MCIRDRKGAARVRKLSMDNPFGNLFPEYPAKAEFTVDTDLYPFWGAVFNCNDGVYEKSKFPP